MVIPEFDIGETVYFINDPVQDEYIVSGYTVRKNLIIYLVSFVGAEKSAYNFEISKEKKIH